MNAIASDKKIVMKARQATSEEPSFCKRRCRDFRFKILGYLCLQIRYTAHTDDRRIAKRNEVVDAKQKHLYLIDGDRPDFAYWRALDDITI